jgi:hypothetical protein
MTPSSPRGQGRKRDRSDREKKSERRRNGNGHRWWKLPVRRRQRFFGSRQAGGPKRRKSLAKRRAPEQKANWPTELLNGVQPDQQPNRAGISSADGSDSQVAEDPERIRTTQCCEVRGGAPAFVTKFLLELGEVRFDKDLTSEDDAIREIANPTP